MTLDDVGLLYRFWKTRPPVSELLYAIAIRVGAAKPPKKEVPAQPVRPPTIAEIKLMFPDGIIRG